MQSLDFNSGYKEFCINGDESRVIRFNPADYSMLKRFSEAKKNIIHAVSEIEKGIHAQEGEDELEETAKLISSINEVINSQINYIFDANVAQAAFGNQSPISTVKGKFLFELFLEAAGPYIEKEIKAEQAASQKRIEKYAKQVR